MKYRILVKHESGHLFTSEVLDMDAEGKQALINEITRHDPVTMTLDNGDTAVFPRTYIQHCAITIRECS